MNGYDSNVRDHMSGTGAKKSSTTKVSVKERDPAKKSSENKAVPLPISLISLVDLTGSELTRLEQALFELREQLQPVIDHNRDIQPSNLPDAEPACSPTGCKMAKLLQHAQTLTLHVRAFMSVIDLPDPQEPPKKVDHG